MELSTSLAERLKKAQEALTDLPGSPDPRLLWLERQLVNLVAQLQAMLTDIEAGVSISAMGFSGEEEFQEMLADLDIDIANLKGLIRTMKSVSRR